MSEQSPGYSCEQNLSGVVERLERQIPRPKLRRVLTRLADRLEELAKTEGSAGLELHLRVVKGRFFEARWDADERIG